MNTRKKNWWHQGLVLLLAVALAYGLLTALMPPVAAAENSGSCGENLTWIFDEASGILTISGEGKMKDYGPSLAPWESVKEEITTVIISDGVNSIGDAAFYGCTKLINITIPSSLLTIGSDAFVNCAALECITIPNGVTAIGSYAFSNCRSLESITIPNGVTTIECYTFVSCSALKSVVIPNSVTAIESYAFSHCTAVESVTIPDGIETIEANAFLNCLSLNDIYIPDTVTDIVATAFNGTPWLESQPDMVIAGDHVLIHYKGTDQQIVVPDGVKYLASDLFSSENYGNKILSVALPEGLLKISSGAFYKQNSLEEIILPSTLREIGGAAFYGCEKLTSVEIPESVAKIGNYAFCYCSALKEIAIPATVSRIGCAAFNRTPWLDEQTGFVIVGDGILLHYHGAETELVIPSGVKYIVDYFWSFDGKDTLYTDGNGQLSSVTFPDGLLEIGAYAFDGFQGTELFFPSTLRSIGDCSFYNAKNLTSVFFYGDAPQIGINVFKTGGRSTQEPAVLYYIEGSSGWTSPIWKSEWNEYPTATWDGLIPYAAEGGNIYFNAQTGAIEDADETITAASIPTKIKGWDVRWIMWTAFFGCDRRVTVTIPESVTSMESGTFRVCPSLTGIWVDEQNEFYSSDAAGVLFDKNQTTLICAPCGIQGSYTIPNSVTHIGEYAFQSCSGLTSISIPGSVTGFGKNVFEGCESLSNLIIAEGVTDIGPYAFAGCISLTSVVIPKSVEWIRIGAFMDCSELASITILNPQCAVCCVSVSGQINSSLGMPGLTTVYSYEGATGYIEDMDKTGVYAYYPQSYAETFGYDFRVIASDQPTPIDPVENPFIDVPENRFYYKPVLWAVDNGITQGMTETTFEPELSCTRGQVVTFLWRACGSPEPQGTDCPFVDVSASRFYYQAVLWAVENGITAGIDATHFAPEQTVTRSQFVTFLWRAEGKPQASGAETPFTDLNAERFYYSAVLWAVENDITAGLDKTHFAPESPCTRGQVVTFLYRNFYE
ncbi:MAG: leucine-rich repeat protein [Clostridiales bacterium]|nr:leucine-rich repeat protein [Clostridiales bacterium]